MGNVNKFDNQINGNIYIITSGGVYLTNNDTVNGSYPEMAISNIGFYGTDTTGELELSVLIANTLTTIFHLKTQAQQGGYDEISFSTPQKVSKRVFVTTLTAGTGYLYFS